MSGQLSDFLAAYSNRVADRLGSQASELGLVGQGAAGQFLNAVLIALSADDLRPLNNVFGLDPQKSQDLDRRLDGAMRALSALSKTTDTVARDVLDPPARVELALDGGAELAGIGRRLATQICADLARQLAQVSSSSTAHGTSLSITMHELRRPLTILNSYGQLLSTGMLGELPESALIALEGITTSTEMMIQMVSALAELSRLEDPDDMLRFEVMSAVEVIDGAFEQVSPEAKMRGVEIIRDVQDGVVMHADRRRITLAVTNVLSNAVKHSPEGAVTTLKVFLEAGQVHFVVTDHGPGFPAEDASHLFEKYFRSAAERQRKVPGSGLGLYIVKTVAERHKGRVEARAADTGGAEFEIVIPQGSVGTQGR